MKKNFLCLALVAMASACSHSVHQVHAGGFENDLNDNSGELIMSQSEQVVYFYFAQDNHYADQAYDDLLSQCQDGRISGITANYKTSHGFFHWTNKLTFKGKCLR